MKRNLLGILALLFTSCSFSNPPDEKTDVIRTYFESIINADIRSMNRNITPPAKVLELMDVQKLDGMEKNGTYYYSFEITVKALYAFCDGYGMYLKQPETNSDYAEDYRFLVLYEDCKPGDFRHFPKGTVFKLRGELPLEKTENGWRLAIDPRKGPQSFEYMDEKFYKMKSEVIRPAGADKADIKYVGTFVSLKNDEELIIIDSKNVFHWYDEFGPVTMYPLHGELDETKRQKSAEFLIQKLGSGKTWQQYTFEARVRVTMGNSHWDYILVNDGDTQYLVVEPGGAATPGAIYRRM